MKRPTALSALVLLFIGVGAVVFSQAVELRQRLHRQHLETAQDALSSIAASLTRACELGIPLEKISGVDEFVRSRLGPDVGLSALQLVNHTNQVVWQQDVDSKHVVRELEAPVANAGRLQAAFEQPSDALAIGRMAGLLLSVALAAALVLLELARFSDVARRGFVARHLHRQAEAMQRGDFRVVRRVASDTDESRQLRVLRDRTMTLGEQFDRVVRLVVSLRRTEPDDDKRIRMGQLMDALHRRYRFARAGVVHRRVWAASATARCFAAFAVLFANFSFGEGSLTHLAIWSLGFLAGAWLLNVGWQVRLMLSLMATVATNVLLALGLPWLGVAGCLFSGMATSLAIRAAMGAGRAEAMSTGIGLFIVATIAAPVLGSAASSALDTLADPRWLYIAAAILAVLTATALLVQLADQPTFTAHRPWRVRPAWPAFFAGVAVSAAWVAFVFDGHDRHVWLLLVQLPAWFLVTRASAGVRVGIAVTFAIVAVVSLGAMLLSTRLSWPTPEHLAWVGSVCIAGGVSSWCMRVRVAPSRIVTGFGLGLCASLLLLALAGILKADAQQTHALALSLLISGLLAQGVWRNLPLHGAAS